jgi:hypothetical protein
MTRFTIERVLRERGAWLKGASGDEIGAAARAELTRLIGARYARFEALRDALMRLELATTAAALEELAAAVDAKDILEQMIDSELIVLTPSGHLLIDTRAKRYLTGGWLEELAWLAAISAGADEAIYGQVVGWEVKGYTGENEIDLIMRKGDALSFVSCKALRSELDINDKKHRNRLMDAVHEADNLADHFGEKGEKVAVLVTTDLYDEIRDSARYQALMGKAAVLDVRLIALEELVWDKLLDAFQSILPSFT